MLNLRNQTIYIALAPVDMRKSFDGLAAIVKNSLNEEKHCAECGKEYEKMGIEISESYIELKKRSSIFRCLNVSDGGSRSRFRY